jgi:hypothetical protein
MSLSSTTRCAAGWSGDGEVEVGTEGTASSSENLRAEEPAVETEHQRPQPGTRSSNERSHCHPRPRTVQIPSSRPGRSRLDSLHVRVDPWVPWFGAPRAPDSLVVIPPRTQLRFVGSDRHPSCAILICASSIGSVVNACRSAPQDGPSPQSAQRIPHPTEPEPKQRGKGALPLPPTGRFSQNMTELGS